MNPMNDTATSAEPMSRQTHGPLVIARSGDKVTLRDSRTVTLVATMAGPNRATFPRCQAIATRFELAADGSQASQCEKPSVHGLSVCGTHGGSAGQTVAAAKRRLELMAPTAVEILYAIAMDETAKHADRIRAAESILDRGGVPRRSDIAIDPEEARRSIVAKLDAFEAAGQAIDPDDEYDDSDDEGPGEVVDLTDDDPAPVDQLADE